MERQELLRLIDKAAEDQQEMLYLIDKQITEIPTEIEKLTNLTHLYLSSNQITEIPAAIAKLTNLTKLVLYNNQITEIPEAIWELTNLSCLSIKGNKIKKIPKKIGKLTNLYDLDLGSNQITEIPAAIGKLTNLIMLDLSDNLITEIPAVIGKLTNLATLEIWHNQIIEIPATIADLTNLNDVNFSSNLITEIPNEIAKLTNLTNLCLNGNQITEIPIAIEKLTNLTNIELSRNQINKIPVEISRLTNLISLYLNNNQITKIPQCFQSSQNLERLYLHGNPIPIPREILGSLEVPGDLQAILSFYFQTQDPKEVEPLYESKFVIVGECEAGKTTLAKKLKDSDYVLKTDEKSTEGIDVTQWEFTQPNGKPFRVNIWDFGGQEIYHATHQFFLTERSLYTLVVDNRRENPNFYYWLNVVRLLSNNSPVFIIKNEKQNCECKIDEGQLRREFDNLQNSVCTNFADNRGLPDIHKAIQKHITTLPHLDIPIPKTWVRIRAVLENYSQNQNYISVEEYYTLCQTNGLKDRQEMLIISKYLHDLGICLHFQKDPVLKHHVILNPTWATNAVYRVTDTDTVKANNGCFTRTDLETIWGDVQYAQMHDELLQLMQNFGICYPIRNLTHTYIAPSLLSLTEPDYTWNEAENLILRYEYEFMPRGIVTRFIVEMHNLIESLPAPAPPTSQLVWKNGVILTDSRARAEVIEYYHKNEIRIRVAGSQKKSLL